LTVFAIGLACCLTVIVIDHASRRARQSRLLGTVFTVGGLLMVASVLRYLWSHMP
jgi:hypothetical protein